MKLGELTEMLHLEASKKKIRYAMELFAHDHKLRIDTARMKVLQYAKNQLDTPHTGISDRVLRDCKRAVIHGDKPEELSPTDLSALTRSLPCLPVGRQPAAKPVPASETALLTYGELRNKTLVAKTATLQPNTEIPTPIVKAIEELFGLLIDFKKSGIEIDVEKRTAVIREHKTSVLNLA